MRHAQTIPQDGVDNKDWGLSKEGIHQSAMAVPALQKLNIHAIYSSPYPRAIECITPFAENAELDIYTHDGFKDLSVIEKTVAPTEFQALVQKMFTDKTFADPTGESFDSCQKRFIKAMNDVAKRHEGQNVLICSHGMPIGSVLQAADPAYSYNDWSRMKMPHIFRFVSDGTDGIWDKDFKLDLSL